MPTPSYQIKNLDHLGLVAGMCRELEIAEMIDAVVPKQHDCHVTHGQALVAMLLNGLGFHSRTLHMYSDFFATKPTERLIGEGIKPEHLNDDVLGRCLDALFEADVSMLYQVMAERVVKKLGLRGDAVHLDITSFHVDGDYDHEDEGRLQLVKGYSRDHRPELNQVILELICENQAGIPVYMQAMNGNTNDQKAFADIAKNHISCLKAAQNSRYFVGDAALYTADTLIALKQQGQLFVSRVPMTLNEAKTRVRSLSVDDLTDMGNGYAGQWQSVTYAGVKQRWLLVRSEQAYQRESHTREKHLARDTQAELKRFDKLCKQAFACEADAQQALEAFSKDLCLLEIDQPKIEKRPSFKGKGRPKKDQQPDGYVYHIQGHAITSLEKVANVRAQTGVFILATNDLTERLDMQGLLDTYKSQQSVERGFRFLKSPEFLTSSLFLKKPERIEALLMVMTCSLMIYAALEHRIREQLKAQDKHILDMKNKPTQKPTARWVFLRFDGIHELHINEAIPIITGLNEQQQIVLQVLGKRYLEIYS